MLHRLPAHMPPLSAMLADLAHPSAHDVARALGVTERTVYRWIASDDAPRPVLLSLFWVTQWGSQWLDADLYNRATLYQSLAESLQREKLAQEEQSAHMGRPGLLYLVR